MADEVILNKVAIMECCLKRVAEEYEDHEDDLEISESSRE